MHCRNQGGRSGRVEVSESCVKSRNKGRGQKNVWNKHNVIGSSSSGLLLTLFK